MAGIYMKAWQIVFLFVLFLFHMLDLGTTVYGLSTSPFIVETNPVFTWINDTRTLENFALFSLSKLLMASFVVLVFALGFNRLNNADPKTHTKLIKGCCYGILLGGMIISLISVMYVVINNFFVVI